MERSIPAAAPRVSSLARRSPKNCLSHSKPCGRGGDGGDDSVASFPPLGDDSGIGCCVATATPPPLLGHAARRCTASVQSTGGDSDVTPKVSGLLKRFFAAATTASFSAAMKSRQASTAFPTPKVSAIRASRGSASAGFSNETFPALVRGATAFCLGSRPSFFSSTPCRGEQQALDCSSLSVPSP